MFIEPNFNAELFLFNCLASVLMLGFVPVHGFVLVHGCTTTFSRFLYELRRVAFIAGAY